jgi:hypothetical protein
VTTARVVALCTGATPFADNQILTREVATKYPGALWIPELADKLSQRGIPMVTGDVALRGVRTGEIHPAAVWVIEEDRSPEADELIRLGAKGKILLCFESPLFAPNFYRSLTRVSRRFDHCVVFRGVLKDVAPTVDAHPLYFPSFDVAHAGAELPWHARKHLVMVAGNKYWQIRRSPLRQIAATIRDLALRRPARNSKENGLLQLHDERLAAISHFGRKGALDLYGGGWGNLTNLPPTWQSELFVTISHLNPQPCVEKLATMGSYKFALCFENMEFPGYVTEKIIDCLVAGVVPIYRGAPDIAEFIPSNCFIDAKNFDAPDALDAHLNTLSEMEWREISQRGRAFINSEEGRIYSYAGFAARLEKMLFGQEFYA